MSFSPAMDELRASIDAELGRFLMDRRARLPEAEHLLAEITRMIGAGGKRLRPAFCYWGYRAGGGDDGPSIVRAAAGFELLHTFALVHDDIMDRSEVRRGGPSSFVHVGLERALLVGDLALVLADAAVIESGFPADVLARAFEAYTGMRARVIAGQDLDLDAASRQVTEDEARRIAVLKSGSYSVEEPLIVGALFAGAGPGLTDELGAFGRPLGEAFQLRDDLLGIFGDPEETGKPVDSDIREGKRNVLFAKTVAGLQETDRNWFMARWGARDDLSDEDVARLRALVESSGAKEATEGLLDELYDGARRTLDAMTIPEEARAALAELAHRAVSRAA